MIKVTLEIDNKTAHSCSPLEFLRKYILHEVCIVQSTKPYKGQFRFENNYAHITVKKIEQV